MTRALEVTRAQLLAHLWREVHARKLSRAAARLILLRIPAKA